MGNSMSSTHTDARLLNYNKDYGQLYVFYTHIRQTTFASAKDAVCEHLGFTVIFVVRYNFVSVPSFTAS